MYIHLKPKRCRLASNSRYFVNIKYIIIYNVFSIVIILIFNKLPQYTPKFIFSESYIHLFSVFFIFYFFKFFSSSCICQ